jgi:hypothetical protein
LGVDAALELRRELRAEALRGSAVAEVVRGCMAHAAALGAGGWEVKPGWLYDFVRLVILYGWLSGYGC